MNAPLRAIATLALAAVLSGASAIAALADPLPTSSPTIGDPTGTTTTTVTATVSPSPAPTGTTTTTTVTATVSAPTASPTTVGGTITSTTVSSTGAVQISETTATVTTSSGSVTTDGTTTTLSAPTVTATTTGTSGTVTVPPATVTVGDVSGGSTPDLSVPSPGSGTADATGSVTPSGNGLAAGSDATTDLASTAMATGSATLDKGVTVDATASEPVSGTTLSGSAGARALLCLLAEASVNPTSAAFSSLCGGAPSTAGGDAGLDVTNAATGTHITSGAALRAAICLLGLVSSPLPTGTNDAEGNTELASASLSSVCGSGGSGDLSATNDRTGTTVTAAPVVAAATCILANGTVGDPTVAQLSSLCAPVIESGGPTPSTVDASAPTSISDKTTDTNARLAPAARAATCILLDALAQVPSGSEPAASADLSTACGGTSPGEKTPSQLGSTAPTSGTVEGPTGTDVTPSVNAAVCILTSAQAATSGSSLSITDACASTTSVPPGTITTTPAPETGTTPENNPSTPPETQTTVAGQESALVLAAPAQPAGGTVATAGGAPAGQLGQQAPAPQAPTGIAGLPSTSTAAAAGAGLLVALFATMAALGRRRHIK